MSIKSETFHLNVENTNLLRNINNYKVQIEQNDYNCTGIVDDSIFNSIPSFQVTQNIAVDGMHDAFEGVIKYGLVKILNYFINDKKTFTL